MAVGTGEVQIGTYDGVPLYQKTFSWAMNDFVTSTAFKAINIPHGIGFSKVIRVDAVIRRNSDGRAYSMPYIDANSYANTKIDYIDATNAICLNKAAWGSGYTLYITLQYTKL